VCIARRRGKPHSYDKLIDHRVFGIGDAVHIPQQSPVAIKREIELKSPVSGRRRPNRSSDERAERYPSRPIPVHVFGHRRSGCLLRPGEDHLVEGVIASNIKPVVRCRVPDLKIIGACILGVIGVKAGWSIHGRLDAALFGEEPSRFVVSVAPAKAANLKKEAARQGVRLIEVGEVGGTRLMIEGLVNARLEDLRATWYGALEGALRGAAER